MLPIAFKPLCLIILLLLAAGLLGCAAAATPAPQSALPVAAPTATPADFPDRTDAPAEPPMPPPRPPSPYTNMDFNLSEPLLAVEEGWSRASPPWAEDAFLYPARQWIEVRLSDNLGAVVRWLEAEGAALKNVRSGSILAVVPVSLLGELSEKDGVYAVDLPHSFFSGPLSGSFPGPVVVCPPDCGGDSNSDLAEVRVGQTQDLFLFSNTDAPPGNLVRVNAAPGDTGELAIGSCDSPRKRDQFLKNGEYITIAACAVGTASVELFEQDKAAAKAVWKAGRDYGIKVVSPPDPGLSPSITLSVFEVGQSRTFTLNTTIPNPPGVKVSVNDEETEGNLAIGNCPGIPGEGVILDNGDSVTITGCVPGSARVTLWMGEHWSGHRVTVWAE